MTSYEAIQRIQTHNEIHSRKEPNAIYITEALQIAVKALEKQIPLKPTTFGKGLFDCAFCGRVLEKHSHNYCPKCGHKLDWSE
jgi:rubrerythrin